MTKKKARRKARRQGKKRPRGSRGVSYEQVCAIARELPGVEESTSYGTPSLKVKGKILSRLRTEAEGALAIRCDFLDRQILLQADRKTFFVTDHYLNYPMVLVRLEKVTPRTMRDLLERAWRMSAPAKLIAQFEVKVRQA